MLDFSRLPLLFDCHIHAHSLDGSFAWSWAPTPSMRTCEDLVRYLDRLSIRGAVLMSSTAALATSADQEFAGNRELVELLRLYPARFTAGVSVNGNWPDQSIEAMETVASPPAPLALRPFAEIGYGKNQRALASVSSAC